MANFWIKTIFSIDVDRQYLYDPKVRITKFIGSFIRNNKGLIFSEEHLVQGTSVNGKPWSRYEKINEVFLYPTISASGTKYLKAMTRYKGGKIHTTTVDRVLPLIGSSINISPVYDKKIVLNEILNFCLETIGPPPAWFNDANIDATICLYGLPALRESTWKIDKYSLINLCGRLRIPITTNNYSQIIEKALPGFKFTKAELKRLTKLRPQMIELLARFPHTHFTKKFILSVSSMSKGGLDVDKLLYGIGSRVSAISFYSYLGEELFKDALRHMTKLGYGSALFKFTSNLKKLIVSGTLLPSNTTIETIPTAPASSKTVTPLVPLNPRLVSDGFANISDVSTAHKAVKYVPKEDIMKGSCSVIYSQSDDMYITVYADTIRYMRSPRTHSPKHLQNIGRRLYSNGIIDYIPDIRKCEAMARG